jgi:hypothetical protein
MTNLPLVKVPFKRRNVHFIPVYDSQSGLCMNIEEMYLPKRMEDAEVLMLNINAGTMRVRIIKKDKFGTFDTDIAYFVNRYDIIKRPDTW